MNVTEDTLLFICGFGFACFIGIVFDFIRRVSNDDPDIESTLVFKTNKMTIEEKRVRFSTHMNSLDEIKDSRDIETDSVSFSVKGRELIEDKDNFPYKIVVQYWLEDDFEEEYERQTLQNK